LLWLAEARSQEEWVHTANLMAMLANLHRDPKKHAAYKPSDFYPKPHKSAKPTETADIGVLKTIFVDRRQ